MEVARKYIILALLMLIVFLAIGSFFCHYIYLASYQKTHQASLKNDINYLSVSKYVVKSSKLYVNTPNVIWQDNKNEVIINEVLYDVISIDTLNGNAVLNLVSDVEEEKLKEDFAELFDANKSESKNSLIKLLKKILALKYTTNVTSTQFLYSNYSLISNGTNFSISNPYLLKDYPPPKSFI